MQKTRQSLPKHANRRNGVETIVYAYEIDDANFGLLRVLYTANGWWKDKEKLLRLIDAYKINADDSQACFYAGIKRSRLDYFIDLHPEFLEIRAACRGNLKFVAKNTIAKEIKTNASAAFAYLKHEEDKEKRQAEEAKKRQREEEGEPANEIVFVDFSDPANALPAGKENDDAKSE